jgi:flagellin-like hook-associated protein FlgL
MTPTCLLYFNVPFGKWDINREIKLFEFKNVLDVTYGAYVVNGAYTGVRASASASTQPPKHDQAIAVIREFLAGKTAAVRQSAEDASTAVSAMQIFTYAIETIAEKLAKMSELAEKVLDQHYSPAQTEQMQKQFRNLAQQINQTANGTEYKFNKPLSGDGRTLSIPTGNGTKIDIFARDFRINAEELNTETDPQEALSKVSEAIINVSEYKTYLDRQAAHLRDITAALESQIQGAMGVDMHDFQPELAAPMADYAASLISQDKQTSLNTQANLTPDEIFKLLRDNG